MKEVCRFNHYFGLGRNKVVAVILDTYENTLHIRFAEMNLFSELGSQYDVHPKIGDAIQYCLQKYLGAAISPETLDKCADEIRLALEVLFNTDRDFKDYKIIR
jgi:hypothetical protein